MGFGINGYRCDDCRAEWNAIWSSVTMEFPSKVCPNCVSENIKVLKQTVPFRRNDGLPPDHVYHCVCGKIFQKQPDADFDPLTANLEKIQKQLYIECPFCKRKNTNDLSWYVPKE